MKKKQLSTKRRTFLMGLTSSFSTIAFSRLSGCRYNQNYSLNTLAPSTSSALAPSLKEVAKIKGFVYGAAATQRILSSDQDFATHFLRECGIISGSDLKWASLRPSPNQFDFSAGDWIARFARVNNILMRGHTLVWHKSLPHWFQEYVTTKNAKHILLNHISTVVGHYAGAIHSWDVVNEAISWRSERSDYLRESPWLDLLGSSYIELAFRAAADSDPNALLVYNETGLEYDTPRGNIMRVAVLQLLERLKATETPIHALGIESHLNAQETRLNPIKLRDFLRQVADLGLKILITEMDVSDAQLPSSILRRDHQVAAAYHDYLSVVLEEPAVIAVLTWGLSDRYTWLSERKPREDGLPVRPLPLDSQFRRKPAWHTIATAFDDCPIRPTT